MSRSRGGNPGIVFEPMVENDLDAILEIEAASFASPWTKDSFLFDLRENPFSRASVARDETGEAVGYACCWHLYEELKINNIAVRPDRRRAGIGRALLRHVLEQGQQAKCKVALLEVRPSNTAARTMYESAGFRQVGRRRDYYRMEKEDALVLALELERRDP